MPKTYEVVGDVYMVIRQRHNTELVTLVIVETYILAISIIALFNNCDMIMLLMIIIFHFIFMYSFMFELRTYEVCDIGIKIKWLGGLCYVLRWSEIKYVCIGKIKLKFLEHDSIICSCIPIKRLDVPSGINSYLKYISYDWLYFRPLKVISIYFEDLEPGQYEEFWSYVPEHLKGNYMQQK